MALTIDDLKAKNLLLLECISGSRAYGLSTPTSDTDIRGVFVLPEEDYFGLNYVEQISNESNDVVYYELKRFVELLSKNNPNMLELLAMPDDCIRFKHPLFDRFKTEAFLSKLCRTTFAGYALAQVKKARGLKKKIVNPVEPERRSVLDFCYVAQGQGSVPVQEFLAQHNLRQEACGLTNIPHMPDLYALFHEPNAKLKGIVQSEKANDVSLSSIPKGLQPLAVMSFNKNAYSTYCKEYKEYWEWVEKRNQTRYENTLSHGKNYDAKNLMHTFRLLDMAEEIATQKQIIVRRPNREFLLQIKVGAFEYAELLAIAEERIAKMDELYWTSDLPEEPDLEKLNELMVEVRKKFYNKN
ncbi:nucleotidyltransferase domain-containing protein [Pontibacter sp. BT310]|uniref:Nucleotidyltransferase domain-containing protein n=1 Tax=Pontibacter populi TaxID=890055 RepID=A0ABS6XAC9_9BACT|nr:MULTISPECIES: nucleotidyltransferase domain-containing protein [Pontibacter]MBJ6118097.1 nucleotidyltransferase domain-containing protein [Pontibacter sp. BT310]MBR0570524.1 nucleotidyltransferase domain-containing protein [Microvirga sp. STS03]MBW3364950.1 nucleotidyltransferase domain-containing protein [Pontibacter populi]